MRHDLLAARAKRQLEDIVEIPGPRGNIYDRNEQLMATSVPVEVLAVEPRKVNPNVLCAIETAAGAERGRLTRRAATAGSSSGATAMPGPAPPSSA